MAALPLPVLEEIHGALLNFTANASYVHITSDNTIKGTQWSNFPDGNVPLIADMSSDIMNRPFDPQPFGMIYAGAQKNIGPAGVCMVIVRSDMLEKIQTACRAC